jgi:D-alanyl-D-alanine carboxypeptidase
MRPVLHRLWLVSFILFFTLLGCVACVPVVPKLDSLGVSYGNFGTFDPGTTTYNMTVPSSISSIIVTPVAQATSTIQLRIYSDKFILPGNVLPPNATSQTVSLAPGKNTISIFLQDGTQTNVYDLIIVRAYSEDASTFGTGLDSAFSNEYIKQTTLGADIVDPTTGNVTPQTDGRNNQPGREIVGGTGAAISSDGKYWTGAVGVNNKSLGDKLSPSMNLGIGSITKTFMSALTLKLMEQGYDFSLDSPISKWPDLLLVPANKINPSITIRQLLNHTSGLSDETATELNNPLDKIRHYGETNGTNLTCPTWNTDAQGNPTCNTTSSPAPFQYANFNYQLLGLILTEVLQNDPKRVSATDSVHAALHRYFLDPLNLRNTQFLGEEALTTTLGNGYFFFWDSNGKYTASPTYQPENVVSINYYAGSIITTSENLARWAEALYKRGPDGASQLLSKDSLDKMLGVGDVQNKDNVVSTIDPTTHLSKIFGAHSYGLGVELYDDGSIGHGGDVFIYTSSMHFKPLTGETAVAIFNEEDTAGILILMASPSTTTAEDIITSSLNLTPRTDLFISAILGALK